MQLVELLLLAENCYLLSVTEKQEVVMDTLFHTIWLLASGTGMMIPDDADLVMTQYYSKFLLKQLMCYFSSLISNDTFLSVC